MSLSSFLHLKQVEVGTEIVASWNWLTLPLRQSVDGTIFPCTCFESHWPLIRLGPSEFCPRGHYIQTGGGPRNARKPWTPSLCSCACSVVPSAITCKSTNVSSCRQPCRQAGLTGVPFSLRPQPANSHCLSLPELLSGPQAHRVEWSPQPFACRAPSA